MFSGTILLLKLKGFVLVSLVSIFCSIIQVVIGVFQKYNLTNLLCKWERGTFKETVMLHLKFKVIIPKKEIPILLHSHLLEVYVLNARILRGIK